MKKIVSCLVLVVSCARHTPAPMVVPEARTSTAQSTSPRALPEPLPTQTAQPGPLPTPPAQPSRCSVAEPAVDRASALGFAPSLANGTPSYPEPAVFLRVDGTAPQPRSATDSSGPLVLTLNGPARLRPRDGLSLRVSASNTGSTPFSLLKSNDGSFEQMREPYVDLYLERVADHQVYRYASVVGRCGMMNGVTNAEVVSLAPSGQSEAPFGEWSRYLREARVPVAGRYRVWVVYRLCDDARMMATGPFTLPADLHRDRVTSNAIEIVVR